MIFRLNNILRIALKFILGFYLFITISNLPFLDNHNLVLAQSLRPNQIAEIVYQKLPEIPLENNYIRQDNGQVDPENTLISRLLRYHQYVKKRPTTYRLDWQLTLADYLDVNEKIKPERYPGYRQLRENPLPGDQKAIDSLTREQRSQLVDLLVNLNQN
jgi:hypothetical protein